MITNSRVRNYFTDIPTEIVPLVLAPIEQSQEILIQCLQWLEAQTPFCIISGSNGTGKTVLSCQMSFSWIRHKDVRERTGSPEARFAYARVLYHQWLDEMRLGSVYGLLKAYSKPDMLVLDDIGERMPSEGWREWLAALVDLRMSECKRTIITTNADSKKIQDFYGESFLSRILAGTQIKIIGRDRRISEQE